MGATLVFSHGDWTREHADGYVKPAGAAAAAAPRVTTRQAARSGPSPAYRKTIGKRSLLCMLGDEDDETALRLGQVLGHAAAAAHWVIFHLSSSAEI